MDLRRRQAQYIVALWGMESSFGKIQGKEDVFSALATLAFEGRREAFFTKEFMSALKIVDSGHATSDMMKGSWAGAMGQSQFMPSSYLNYGADGKIDNAKLQTIIQHETGHNLPLDDPRMIQFKGSVQQLATLGLQPAA